MSRFSTLDIFIAVVECSSFTMAGKNLNMTGSAISKQIQNLEKSLSAKLFYRTTRKVTLTEAGQLYFQRASNASNLLAEAKEELKELQSTPTGQLKVNIPMSFGMRYLSSAIIEFCKNYPDIKLNVRFTDRLVDVVAEGYDVVIRIGNAVDSSLRAKKIATGNFYATASKQYFEQNGLPKVPADLKQHKMIAYSGKPQSNTWIYKDLNNKQQQLHFEATYQCDSGDMINQFMLAGMGISIAPIFVTLDHLKSGQLQTVLTEYETLPNWDIYALYPAQNYLTKKARLFIDWITKTCQEADFNQCPNNCNQKADTTKSVNELKI
ncbi:MAG: LysR family transcriptional regulator [Saccharospirillaceae bacterium]|nr:LysR substrate-binding domain-containing protein [Pseudomonadales bacterium]NRB80091.1 LysR family transcriptional regulator [Saccharospirillaceae bacterium]